MGLWYYFFIHIITALFLCCLYTQTVKIESSKNVPSGGDGKKKRETRTYGIEIKFLDID